MARDNDNSMVGMRPVKANKRHHRCARRRIQTWRPTPRLVDDILPVECATASILDETSTTSNVSTVLALTFARATATVFVATRGIHGVHGFHFLCPDQTVLYEEYYAPCRGVHIGMQNRSRIVHIDLEAMSVFEVKTRKRVADAASRGCKPGWTSSS